MKFKLILSFCLFASISIAQQDVWTIKDSINGAPRSVATCFVANGDGFIAGGLDLEGFRRRMYSYTNWQDDWDDEPSIGGDNGSGLSRGSASGFSIGNKGYICLGQGVTNPFFKDLWEFDPVSDIWTQKADFIGSPRRQAVAFTVDDTAYVGTGIDANGLCKDMYKYDAGTNTWTQLADFGGTARKEAVGFSMGGQGYIGTGDDGVKRNDFWQYQPASDSWIQKADFPGTPRKGAVGWGVFPQAFICTGEDINYNYTKDLWEYNYFSNSWVQRADFTGPARTNAVAFVVNGVAYLGTGYNGGFLDDFYAYYKTLGIEDLKAQAKVSIFPNPVQSQFEVRTELSGLTLNLFDMSGRDVSSSVRIQQAGKSFQIDRQMMPAGTYFVRLSDPEHGIIYNGKVIFV